MPKKSRPLATRTAVGPFQLTDRDLRIMREVLSYRALNSDHILALLGGSPTNLRRRLMLLFNAGYLDRWPGQFKEFVPGGGSRPLVYFLGQAGYACLVERGLAVRRRIDWARNNRAAKDNFVSHQLMVAGFFVALRTGLAKIGGVRLVEEPELLASLSGEAVARCRRHQTRIKWPVTIRRNNQDLTMALNPDGFFALDYDPGKWPGKRRDYFFLEADTGSEPIFSHADFRRSAYFKKMLGYWATARDGAARKALGLDGFRVLTVTRLPGRVANLVKANKEVDERGKGTRLFYFAPESRIDPRNGAAILGDFWRNGRDDKALSILD
jgi:hypothetical protein